MRLQAEESMREVERVSSSNAAVCATYRAKGMVRVGQLEEETGLIEEEDLVVLLFKQGVRGLGMEERSVEESGAVQTEVVHRHVEHSLLEEVKGDSGSGTARSSTPP